MKLSLIAAAAIVCATGATPAAFAQSSDAETLGAEPAFVLTTGVGPSNAVDVRYPYREHRARAEGECTVMFDVAPTGEPVNLRPQACSSRDFAREAERVVESLRYPSSALPAAGLSDQSFTFRWEGQQG